MVPNRTPAKKQTRNTFSQGLPDIEVGLGIDSVVCGGIDVLGIDGDGAPGIVDVSVLGVGVPGIVDVGDIDCLDVEALDIDDLDIDVFDIGILGKSRRLYLNLYLSLLKKPAIY